MKDKVKLPAIYRPTSDSLIDVAGITFRLVSMHQLTYDGDWETAGFYLFVANELIGHFYGYPSNKDIMVVFRTYMALKPADYGVTRKQLSPPCEVNTDL